MKNAEQFEIVNLVFFCILARSGTGTEEDHLATEFIHVGWFQSEKHVLDYSGMQFESFPEQNPTDFTL